MYWPGISMGNSRLSCEESLEKICESPFQSSLPTFGAHVTHWISVGNYEKSCNDKLNWGHIHKHEKTQELRVQGLSFKLSQTLIKFLGL